MWRAITVRPFIIQYDMSLFLMWEIYELRQNVVFAISNIGGCSLSVHGLLSFVSSSPGSAGF